MIRTSKAGSNHIFQSNDSMGDSLFGLQNGLAKKTLPKATKNVHPQSSRNHGSNISIKDFLNLKLGQGAVVTVQTPGGTRATITPLQDQNLHGGPLKSELTLGMPLNESSKEKVAPTRELRLHKDSFFISDDESKASPPKMVKGNQ